MYPGVCVILGRSRSRATLRARDFCAVCLRPSRACQTWTANGPAFSRKDRLLRGNGPEDNENKSSPSQVWLEIKQQGPSLGDIAGVSNIARLFALCIRAQHNLTAGHL